MPEISESDLALLQKSYKLLNGLWDDPKVGLALKKAAKEADPSIRIPELDVAEPMLAPIREEMETFKKTAAELREENAALRREREEEKATGDLQSKLDAAQKKYRLTGDGMAEVKKIMIERNIADPAAAAAYVVSEIEPAKPMTGSNFGPTDANVFGIDGKAEDESTKSLHHDPVRWLDSEVPKIMAEFENAA